MLRPSLSVGQLIPDLSFAEYHQVSPGLMLRPSLSGGDGQAVLTIQALSRVAGVDAPAFVERDR